MRTCPDCGKPAPENELAAYGRCEDCAVGDTPPNPFSGTGSRHQFTKISDRHDD